MPRWSGGWGVQALHEIRTESVFLNKDKTVQGGNFTESVHLLHMEGVYTWAKEIRITAKFPVVLDAQRTQPDGRGGSMTQSDRGFGDPTIAVPLKSYFNLDGRSGSWTFAPQVRIPGGTRDEYNIFDRDPGAGLALGYETETYRYHAGVSAVGWYYARGDQPAQLFLNAGIGVNVQMLGSSGHFKIKSTLLVENDNSMILNLGPTFYWRVNDTLHAQVQWRYDVLDYQGEPDHGEGQSFRTGLGLVF